ncbi:TPA: phenylalanine--tRNA ligase subunit alpha, partial [Candidatus Uhrbacteria bacterium]|nr:phenylalanine--tRNA ligase subunit alpha [Candidatus Uhrbacteria bacterium]
LAIKAVTKLPIEKRPAFGILANEVKQTIEKALEEKAKSLSNARKINLLEKIDVTNPGVKPPLGHLHLVSLAIEEITEIFEKIGFVKVRYPEVEWDWYAFEALNFPPNHPARDDWETFFIDEKPHPKYGPMVLTPHTSSGQIREMTTNKPPIKMLNIAKCYRRQSDVSHVPMFHQFEGLLIDKGVTIAQLKGVFDFFVKRFFGPEREVRLRPHHFRFTEPSFELDISCNLCGGSAKIAGKKCRMCKQGWLELGGAGMVHPNVLHAGGLDPKEYNGFAFGWGVERTLMMKSGMNIDDIRILYKNDLRFLKQF